MPLDTSRPPCLRAASLLVLGGCLSAPAVETVEVARILEAPPPRPPPPPPLLELVAVGDMIPHDSVKAAAERYARSYGNEGWDGLFEAVAPTIQQADLAFVNLETPVAPATQVPVVNVVFDGPLAMLPALKNAGFDALSLANNHVWDQGVSGLVETVGHIEAQGLAYAGAGRDCSAATTAKLLKADGFTVGWISTTDVHNYYRNRRPQDPCVFKLDAAKILAEGKKARDAGAEIVILSIHWGIEYQTQPRDTERRLAIQLLEGGIDGIFGHHPHVLQPIEELLTADGRRSFVAYSLGNFLTGQGAGYKPASSLRDGLRRDSGILRVRYGRAEGKVVLQELELLPTWTDWGECGGGRRLSVMLLGGPGCAEFGPVRVPLIRRAVGEGWVREG